MWPFDKLLVNKIRDLERHTETLIGQNQILERELQFAKDKEAQLLSKLFEVTGIQKSNSQASVVERKQQTPIRMTKSANWPGMRTELEIQSRKDYWEKKQDKQTKSTSELEKELNINAS